MTSFRDLTLPPPEPSDERVDVEQLAAEVAELTEQLAPFQTPIWDRIEKIVRWQRDLQREILTNRTQYTNEQLREVRGNVQAFDWLLEFPLDLREQIKQREQQIEDLEAEQQSEQGEADG